MRRTQIIHKLTKIVGTTPYAEKKEILTQLAKHLFNSSSKLNEDEAQTMFFALVKIFHQAKPAIETLCMACLRVISPLVEQRFFATSSLQKIVDANKPTSSGALRLLSEVADDNRTQMTVLSYLSNSNELMRAAAAISGVCISSKQGVSFDKAIETSITVLQKDKKQKALYPLILFCCHVLSQTNDVRTVSRLCKTINPPGKDSITDDPYVHIALLRLTGSVLRIVRHRDAYLMGFLLSYLVPKQMNRTQKNF
ncbi:hypothetical protein ADUPG1_009123, partial [Aduncisulcus paluster]